MKLIVESISELNDHKQINVYAWFYFLTYVYPEGMEEKNWKNDKRMGKLSFIECMEILKEESLVFQLHDKWFIKNKENARQVLYSVFGKYNSFAEAIDAREKFKQYETKDHRGLVNYPISRIPYDIYDKEDEEIMQSSKIDRSINYYYILNWIKRYQRHAHGWSTHLNQFCGREGDLIRENYTYKLYRGIFMNEEKSLKEGDYVYDQRFSWTLSREMAIRFAYGNKHWVDNKKVIPSGSMGVVLYHIFDPKDILIDMNYVNSKHPVFENQIDFPDESEVIVKPSKTKFQVLKIFK